MYEWLIVRKYSWWEGWNWIERKWNLERIIWEFNNIILYIYIKIRFDNDCTWASLLKENGRNIDPLGFPTDTNIVVFLSIKQIQQQLLCIVKYFPFYFIFYIPALRFHDCLVLSYNYIVKYEWESVRRKCTHT